MKYTLLLLLFLFVPLGFSKPNPKPSLKESLKANSNLKSKDTKAQYDLKIATKDLILKNKLDKNIKIKIKHILSHRWISTTKLQNQLGSVTEFKLKYLLFPYMTFVSAHQFSFENQWKIKTKDMYIHFFNKNHNLFIGYLKYLFSDFLDDAYDFFTKDPYLHQTLDVLGKRDLGLILKSSLFHHVYFYASANPHVIDTKKNLKQTYSASLTYENGKNIFYGSYFYQKLLKDKKRQALGLGMHGLVSKDLLTLRLKTEAWAIKDEDKDILFSCYILPSIKYHQLALSILLGNSRIKQWGSINDKNLIITKNNFDFYNNSLKIWEYNIKADFYLTKNLVFSLQKIKELHSKKEKALWSASLMSVIQF